MAAALTLTPSDIAPIVPDVRLAAQYPDAAQWAMASYRKAASSLAEVWPCQPDEERVRYYVWASRQIRQAHGSLETAWGALTDAFVLLGSVVEDLEEFGRTGKLPVLEDADLDPATALTHSVLDDALPVPRPTYPRVATARSQQADVPRLTVTPRRADDLVLSVLQAGVTGPARVIHEAVIARGGTGIGRQQVSTALGNLRRQKRAVGVGRGTHVTWSAR